MNPARRWPARLTAAVAGVATLLTYNTWLGWRPLNGHPEIFEGYLSEFSAADQPHDLVFRGGDLLTALLVALVSLHARARWRDRDRSATSSWEALAWAGLLLFAVATVLDAFCVLDCSPSLSDACRVAEEQGRLSLIHYAHTWTSVGAQTGVTTSMVAGWLGLTRRPGATHEKPARRRLALGLAVAEVVALVVMMAVLALGLPGLGYPQAVMVVVASLWFAAVGLGLLDAPSSRSQVPLPGRADLLGASREPE